jgi:chemotaxis signal transduction protein
VAEFRSGQYLTVRVARYDFAVLAEHVRAVLPMHELVSQDESGSVAGIVSIGGEPVTVFDLRVRLNLRSGGYGRNPSVVVVQTAEGLAGFVADSASEVIYARAHDFRAGKIRIGRARPILSPAMLAEECVTL